MSIIEGIPKGVIAMKVLLLVFLIVIIIYAFAAINLRLGYKKML